METRKRTTAGVVFWTPAPVRNSRTSTVISEDVWEDEDEEQAGQEDGFFSQMDENGIIGLSEALEDVELGGTWGDVECNPDTEETDTPPEELSYNLSDHLSSSEAPGEDGQIPCDDLVGDSKAWTVDEEERQRRQERGIGFLHERDKYLGMTDEEKDGEEAGKRSDKKRKKNEHSSIPRKVGSMNSSTESYISKGGTEVMSPMRSCSAHQFVMKPAGVSGHRCPISPPATPVTAPAYPHLLHFTAEEMAAPGIEAETFPEMSFTESLPESHKSRISLRSSPRSPERKLRASPQPAAVSSEDIMSNHYSRVSNGPLNGSRMHPKRPIPSPRKMRQPSPEATSRSLSAAGTGSLKYKHQNTSPDREPHTPRDRTNASEVNESRRGPLSYRTPDFSKVEPKVRFPKGAYKPPKSRRSSKRESLSPEPPLVFKSPADIVKEVLLNIPDGSPSTSDSCGPQDGAPDFTVPREFRCPRQATTLLVQLQEDYNTLLTKYAEAENTIDRLRLEAKVNMYSDPPKPGLMVQSRLNQEGSMFMMLDFPQAQRAEINSASLHPDERSSHQNAANVPSFHHLGQEPAKILCNQADKFLQQLQTFEDLIKGKKVKPVEQVKGLSQLAEGLTSLEKGYLLARDQHKLLLQRGAEISHFDPDRDLEGLIFQCGLRLDELKEQVEQMQQEQPTCEAPPSPSPHASALPVPSDGGDALIHPQRPAVPLLVDPGEAVAVDVSSSCEERVEEMQDEEALYLQPLNDKHKCVEQDFATLTEQYQRFKELPKCLDHSQGDGAPILAALQTHIQSEDEEKERECQGTGNQEVQKSLPQTKADQEDSHSLRSSKQQARSCSPPLRMASSESPMPPIDPPSSRKGFKEGKSHSSSLSSLGDITALERRNSKLQTGSSRVLSQDGIVSPETDSGFVGSESSRLTAAAASSPLHQRASMSVLVLHEEISGRPQTVHISAPSPASLLTHRHAAAELSRGDPRKTRQGQRRRAVSSSPQRWVSQTERSTADSGTSDFGLESDSSHTVSEGRQNDQYTKSDISSQSSSPAARSHHGDSLQAQSSSQVANRNDAIQALQAEVTRLRERLESCLRNKKSPSSVRAAPSAQENYSHHRTSATPRVSSAERWSDVRRERREAEESTLRRTTRDKPTSTVRQKPQSDILAASEPSTPQPRPLVSRCTQTSTAAPDSCCSHSNTVRNRTNSRQHPVRVCETADEPDSRSHQASLCPQCLSRHQGQPEGTAGGSRKSTHSSCCRHCPLCRCPEQCRSTEPDCRRVSHSPAHARLQPVDSPDRGRDFAAATPPTLLQCMPVCPPPPLVLYSSPLYVSPSNSTGTSSRVRGRTEEKRRTRRSLSADKQCSVDGSMNRAIRAARHMKFTSGHMARSLASGLHYQELLNQTCSY